MHIVFFGTPDFAVPSLRALVKAGHHISEVVTKPDRPRGRGQRLQSPPVKVCARELGLRVLQPDHPREVAEELGRQRPEVFVVAAYYHILKPNLLAIPSNCSLNVHASLLPRLRGAAPIQRAIQTGEEETGATIIYMDEGMDTGDIALQRRIPIEPDDSGGSLTEKLASLGAAVIVEALQLLEDDQLPRIPQDDDNATYAPIIKKREGEIDWSRPAEEIARQVRAFDPWPKTVTRTGGQPLKIRAATAIEDYYPPKPPGTVHQVIEGRGIVVQAGDRCLLVTKVQPANRKVMVSWSYANGYGLKVGSVWGD